MSITQTVDIPPSRQLTISVPREVPVGRTILTFTPDPVAKQGRSDSQRKIVPSLASLWGIDSERDTMDAYFARKQADKAREDEQFERLRLEQ